MTKIAVFVHKNLCFAIGRLTGLSPNTKSEINNAKIDFFLQITSKYSLN